MINILSHFPSNDAPRAEQITILNDIQKALDNDKKFIIIQAPTGVGKSHIAATMSAMSRYPDAEIVDLIDNYEIQAMNSDGFIYEELFLSKPSYGAAVLTVTKSLQEQYYSLFNNATILKGKQNYVCIVDEDFDCDLAPCLLTPKLLGECKTSNRCPMLNARREALKSRFGVFNYSSYLSLPDFLKKRQFIICDEASELEDEIVKNYSCNIEYSKIDLSALNLERLRTNINGDAYRWLTDLSTSLKDVLKENEEQFKKGKNNKRILIGQMAKYRYYKNLYEKVNNVLQNWYKAEYITEITKDEATFTPLYVNILAQDFFKWGDTVILMSATLIDHELFAQTLGIKKEEYAYIEVDSSFDPLKSPIYFDSKTKLNYKNMDEFLPKLVEKALLICDNFKDEKGIIHTHTFKITEALLKRIKGKSRYLVRESGITNEALLNEHYLRDDATVLISPSLGFGTDLKDEYGRFSIIMKTPYLPLGSERIKRLAAKNQSWYEMKALVCLVQMCGRTTRNIDDHSDTFILDGTALDLIKRNKNKIPRWFLKRIH
ncbi:MAG: helicase C-terminal domain-containing protein [Clostridia bacterium]|nr:helicase C-terminal domain-containing protein [Clostridia bacterium]